MNKLLLALLIAVSPLAFTGCGTPQAIAYKATAITVTTVDGAMNGWGDYVRAGKATDADQKRVRAAYDKYRQALLVERDVVRSNAANPNATAIQAATSALSAAQADLIALVTSIINGK